MNKTITKTHFKRTSFESEKKQISHFLHQNHYLKSFVNSLLHHLSQHFSTGLQFWRVSKCNFKIVASVKNVKICGLQSSFITVQ